MAFLILGTLATWLILSLAVGKWARNRDRSQLGWSVFSFLFSPLAGAACVAVLEDKSMKGKFQRVHWSTHKQCPECCEPVRKEAIKCPHCSSPIAKN